MISAMSRTDVDIAEFRGGLDGPLGGGAGRGRVALVRQRVRQYEERGDPQITSCSASASATTSRNARSLRSDRP